MQLVTPLCKTNHVQGRMNAPSWRSLLSTAAVSLFIEHSPLFYITKAWYRKHGTLQYRVHT